jgi:hypothetical protein
MSKLDVRKQPGYAKALSRIRQLKLRPLVGARDLEELAVVTDVLPQLTFPINSAGELLDQLGEGKTLSVLGMNVDPVRMIKYMPAYYFPIASYENLVEKMAEVMRGNRRDVDEKKITTKLREKLCDAKFPIRSAEEMERALGNTPMFNVNGRRMDTRRTLGELPHGFFPIHDEKDLHVKALRFLRGRPLIEKD